MELTLSDEEADTLRRVLESYLSDLGMEIRETERLGMRQRLKLDETRLKALLDRLPSAPQSASGEPEGTRLGSGWERRSHKLQGSDAGEP